MTNFVEKIFMWKKGVVMNSVTKSNYQMTFGMKEILKPAAIIQHKAKQTYQHISPHVLQTKYGKNQYLDGLTKLLHWFRRDLDCCDKPAKKLIEQLKQGKKLGNGGEETMLATIIGRMNGQKNIYTGNIDGLDHGVSFITNKKVKDGMSMMLKDKDAIIIDPQLGITDYVGNYLSKLKETLNHPFKQKTGISIKPVDNIRISDTQVMGLRTDYPELLIKDYKTINLGK